MGGTQDPKPGAVMPYEAFERPQSVGKYRIQDNLKRHRFFS